MECCYRRSFLIDSLSLPFSSLPNPHRIVTRRPEVRLTIVVHIGLMNISNSIPSSFTIANTQVAVPAVSSLQASLKNIVSLAVGVSTALMVLLVITCIGSAFTAIGSGTSCSLFSIPLRRGSILSSGGHLWNNLLRWSSPDAQKSY